MFEFLKNLFNFKTYSLGAYTNPNDNRDIPVSSVQAPVTIPKKYITDISILPVDNQGSKPSCVGNSVQKAKQYFNFKKEGIVKNLSYRFLFGMAKEVDGIIGEAGTYPRIVAKIATDYGVPSENLCPNDISLSYGDFISISKTSEVLEDAAKNKMGGYAFVDLNFPAIKQAIYQNGVITGTLEVDKNWFKGIIKKLGVILGAHYTLWYGYDEEGIYARNSWGRGWKFFKKMLGINAGDFYFKWDDYKDNVHDVMVFTDMPKEIIEEAKKTPFKFTKDLKIGMTDPEVRYLQILLNENPDTIVAFSGAGSKGKETTYFGNATKDALETFQKRNGLPSTGFFGSMTRDYVNSRVPKKGLSLIDALIRVESGGDDNAIGDLHLGNRAYGCLQIRLPVTIDVNQRFGSNVKPEDMLGNRKLSIWVFDRYMEIYCQGFSDEAKARCWNGGPKGHLKTSTLSYWGKVKKLLV